MWQRVRHLLELIRFSHTIFALPFALLAAALAWHGRTEPFRVQELIGILLCMVFARSAAMAFNRVVDQAIDAQNPRTQNRHLPVGLLRRSTVIAFTILCSLGFVASTLLFLPNWLPLYCSAPVLAFLFAYSFTKRWTFLCHYWLGTALMLSPLAAWVAIRGELAWTPFLLAAAVLFWVGGFDIIYACQDTEFDRQNRLHSVPARWGIAQALRIAMLSHIAVAISLFGLWYVSDLSFVFLGGVVIVTVLLAYEHWLVRPNDLARVGIAFFNVNAVISIGLLLVGLIDLYFTG
jgi:4-hydroxybenzoate polyprenyltransferase